MGLITALVALVIFIILILVVWGFIGSVTGGLPSTEGGVCTILFGADSDFCKSARDSDRNQAEVEKDQEQAERVKPKPVSEGGIGGELRCDLQVNVFAKLDERFFTKVSPTELYVKIDESNTNTYQWYCDRSDWESFLSSFGNLNFTPNAILLAGDTIHTEIVLKMKENKNFKYDANNPDYDMMYRDILLTQTTGVIPTPYNLSPYSEFYVPDVLYGDYDLEIYYGRLINDLEVGQPIKSNVCMDESKVELLELKLGKQAPTSRGGEQSPNAVTTGNKVLPPCR